MTTFIHRETTIEASWLNSVDAIITDPSVTALMGVTPAADKLPYFTGAAAASLTSLSSFARTILDDADASAVLATIGAQAIDAELTAIAGLTSAEDKLPYFTGAASAALAAFTSVGRQVVSQTTLANVLALIGGAALASPAFTGVPTAPTAAVDTSTTQIATTAFVIGQAYAKLASPTFTGTVSLPATGLSGDIDCNNNTIKEAENICFNGVVDDGTSGTSKTIDFTVGQYHKISMTGNCAFTFTAPIGPCVVQLEPTQDGTGSRTYTTSPTLKWPASYAAEDKLLSTSPSARDLLVLRWNGTDYVANLLKGIA